MDMEYSVLERTNWHELRYYPNGDVDIVTVRKKTRATALSPSGGVIVVDVPIPNLSIDGTTGRVFVDEANVRRVKGNRGDWANGKTYHDFPLVESHVNAECVFFSSVIRARFLGEY